MLPIADCFYMPVKPEQTKVSLAAQKVSCKYAKT